MLLLRFRRRTIYLSTSCAATILIGSIGVLVIARDAGGVTPAGDMQCCGAAGHSIDDTLMSWVLTVLIMLFMFCAGVAIVGFPWILMGES